jgi:acyl-coenzyme A synthetase/AMP-(fatty) acid ligase
VYAIYTSGSTGRPKAVVNTHRGVRNRLLWGQSAYRLGGDDVVLQKTPFGFDVSAWEIFWPLLVGARLVLARPGGHRDPAYIRDLIREQGVTVVHFVPSMLGAFLDADDIESCRSIRHVFCSGEALSTDLRDRCLARVRAALHNLYGPTEASVEVTAWSSERSHERTVPIGKPIANAAMYVLDDRLELVPIGMTGDLYIGGMPVARGYLRQPALTAGAFLPDPFRAPGARMYRTGDLARRLWDGNIEYLGRRDGQVKIRGFRVELGEIEASLAQHADIESAVVVGRPAPQGIQLVAYVVAKAGRSGDAAALQRHLKARLPEYMVPSAFVRLESLPLNANGKLDRGRLPAPERADVATAEPYVAPTDVVERAVASVFAEVLRIEQCGAEDDFFAFGGHSLLATELLGRVRRVFGVPLDLREFLETPTVRGVAARLRTQGEARAVEKIAALLIEVDKLAPEEVERRLGLTGGETA